MNSNMLYRNHICTMTNRVLWYQIDFSKFGEIVSDTPQRVAKLSDQIKYGIFFPEHKHSRVSQLAHTL